MKYPVSDEVVARYAAMVRAGDSTKDLFPARMLDCDFTPAQRAVIRQARADRKAALKNARTDAVKLVEAKPASKQPVRPAARASPVSSKSLSKLKTILYLQGGRCFFCRELLLEGEASIEHLNAKSRGGTKTDDNEVVCHKSLNHVFGDMDLKSKFEFVIDAAGKFKCPKP